MTNVSENRDGGADFVAIIPILLVYPLLRNALPVMTLRSVKGSSGRYWPKSGR
ncbi:MAG: hypothetical protein ACLVAW_23190 [Eisenbergiella massiliensis]